MSPDEIQDCPASALAETCRLWSEERAGFRTNALQASARLFKTLKAESTKELLNWIHSLERHLRDSSEDSPVISINVRKYFEGQSRKVAPAKQGAIRRFCQRKKGAA